ncbi:MAG: hypothetical protein JOZ48_01930, partial [Acidobacteriaceae bacterium]|nr:hypothetical protein [Acidobacteriaceae bacterium]
TVGDFNYSLPGVGSTQLTYTFRWRNMSDVLTTSGQQLDYTGDRTQAYPHSTLSPSLFTSPDSNDSVVGGINSSSPRFNPVVLYQIVLPHDPSNPNPPTYTFTYNVYGEIDKIVFPTGGYEQFTYGTVTPLSGQADDGLYSQANRGVTQRIVSVKGDGSDAATWTYGMSIDTSTIPYQLTRTITAPDNTYTQMWFINSEGSSIMYGFDDARAGREYDERSYTATGQMVRRKLMNWTMTTNYTLNGTIAATRNPLLTEEVDILLDTGGNAQAAMELVSEVVEIRKRLRRK